MMPDMQPSATPEGLRQILLWLNFDGTDFCGYQFQEGLRSVQSELTIALEQMVHHKVELHAASRTDAGVHADAFPVTFLSPRDIRPTQYLWGLATFLPPDLSVIGVEEVPLGWNVRHAALAKTYTYAVQLAPRKGREQRYQWSLKRRELDLSLMKEAAAHLLGEHDFSAFQASHCGARTSVRAIHAIEFHEKAEGAFEIVLTGNAFLRNMVRIIVGTLVTVGSHKRPPHWVKEVLLSKDRQNAGPTAPASGLTLSKVHFEGYPRLGKGEPFVKTPKLMESYHCSFEPAEGDLGG